MDVPRNSLGSFEDSYGRVIVPRANKYGFRSGYCAGFCNHGQGPYDDERSALCYCLCQAPMDYFSYRRALAMEFEDELVPVFGVPLPQRPMVVDLGCGPGTTYFALRDWMESVGQKPHGSYLGIDPSEPLRRYASEMFELQERIFGPSPYLLVPTICDLDSAKIRRLAADCDGVVFALSYILHQLFMRDLKLLRDLIARMLEIVGDIPAWFLLQDQNSMDCYGGFLDLWPETRLNDLANLCEEVGLGIGFNKTAFKAPRVRVLADGRFRPEAEPQTNNACFFFHRINRIEALPF